MQDLQMQTLKQGDSRTFPKKGQIVRVRYTGAFANGIVFDQNEILEFQVGAKEVIDGWEEAIYKMTLGQKIELQVPPNLAYGTEGLSDIIPPNSTLKFEIELLSIK